MGTASRGITELTGWTPQAPLSGQRCLTRRAFELASPLAAGWGMEVGMTIDVLRAGLRVEEVAIELRHRATGRDLAGQLHRAKQLRDVSRALAARGVVNADTARAGLAELRTRAAACSGGSADDEVAEECVRPEDQVAERERAWRTPDEEWVRPAGQPAKRGWAWREREPASADGCDAG